MNFQIGQYVKGRYVSCRGWQYNRNSQELCVKLRDFLGMLYLPQFSEHKNFKRRFDLSFDSEPKGAGCKLFVENRK